MKLSRRGLLAVAGTAPVAAVLPSAAALYPVGACVYVGTAGVESIPSPEQLDAVAAALLQAAAAAWQVPVHILEGRPRP